MKSLFKILIIIFSLVLSFWVEPSALQAQPVDTLGYIKNIETETVVFVSNNILNGEISSYQEEATSMMILWGSGSNDFTYHKFRILNFV